MTTPAHSPHGREVPPWQIGRPQPAVVALAERGALRGRVLDVGCGTGEHTLLAARQGLQALGIDLDTTVLETAGASAAAQHLPVDFLPHDARRIDQLAAPPFDTVFDCLLFHALVGADRAAYLTGLTKILRVGGRLILLCYADSQTDVPRRVSRADLLASFQDGWRIDSHQPSTVQTNVHPGGARGWLAVLTRSDRPWSPPRHACPPSAPAATSSNSANTYS